MSDVFISYASKDRNKAEKLAQVLASEGWSVWWDRTMLPGTDFATVIERALDAAHCVIVLWSGASNDSHWVKNEARHGTEHKALIPVLIEDVRPPFEFRHIHAASLIDWNGDVSSPGYRQLVQAISEHADPPSKREEIAQEEFESEEDTSNELLRTAIETEKLPGAARSKSSPALWIAAALVLVLAILGIGFGVHQATDEESPTASKLDPGQNGTEDLEPGNEDEASRQRAEKENGSTGSTGGERSIPAYSPVEALDLEMVTLSDINVREGPGVQYGTIRSLSQGTSVKVTGQTDDWYRVALAGGQVGYVFMDLLGKRAAGPIRIATAGPMTGQYARFGQQMKDGARVAVAALNASGGVLGREVQLSVEDDSCDPREAVKVANRIVDESIVLVVGHFCSSASIPASKVYDGKNIVQISPASTNPKLTEDGGDHVFRTSARDDQQGVVAGNYLADKFGGKRIAILHDKTAYGKGLADETKKQLNRRGVNEALYDTYTAGESGYSKLIEKLKALDIGVIYVGGYHTEVGLMIRQAHQQGYYPQLVSGDALVTDEYWQIAGNAADGTLMTFSPDPRKNPGAAAVTQNFRAKGIEPEGYVLYTYAAIEAWAQAVEAAGTTNAEAVIKELRSHTFNTVMGTFGFDIKGDITTPGYVFYVWRNGKYDYAD